MQKYTFLMEQRHFIGKKFILKLKKFQLEIKILEYGYNTIKIPLEHHLLSFINIHTLSCRFRNLHTTESIISSTLVVVNLNRMNTC